MHLRGSSSRACGIHPDLVAVDVKKRRHGLYHQRRDRGVRGDRVQWHPSRPSRVEHADPELVMATCAARPRPPGEHQHKGHGNGL